MPCTDHDDVCLHRSIVAIAIPTPFARRPNVAMRRWLILIPLLWLAGCGAQRPEDKFVGTYAGDAELPAEMRDNPMAEQVKAMMGVISLKLKADLTFDLQMGGALEGTWKATETGVALQITKANGKTLEDLQKDNAKRKQPLPGMDNLTKPLEFVSESDGAMLRFSAGMGGSIVFRKAS